MRRTGRWVTSHPALTLALAAVLFVLALVGGGSGSPSPSEGSSGGVLASPSVSSNPDASPTPTTPAPAASASTSTGEVVGASPSRGELATDVLETLQVKGRAPRTGYDRTGEFGEAWQDGTGAACNTRERILARDLVDVVHKDGSCKVASGVLHDPYTGTTIDFVRGQQTSSRVQIDHVVALSDAWQKGAQLWDQETRVAFANDPGNLLAVDGPTNEKKGDGDAATWLPPDTSFRCAYVARQIGVKSRYGLWVTQAEKDAMERVLTACPGQEVLGDTAE